MRQGHEVVLDLSASEESGHGGDSDRHRVHTELGVQEGESGDDLCCQPGDSS